MSKARRGMFRSVMATVAGLAASIGIGGPKTHHYDDPVLDPRSRRKKRATGHISRKIDVRPMMRRGNLGPPKCEIGTITYHDKLVKHFGARKARKMHRMLMSQPGLISEVDFEANPPWAFLSTGTG